MCIYQPRSLLKGDTLFVSLALRLRLGEKTADQPR